MERTDESIRKPRRTKGTPSYYYRNRFGIALIVAGTAIYGLFSLTPFYNEANIKIMYDMLTITEEEKDRKFAFNLAGAPRTSQFIKDTIKETEELFSER